MLFASYNFLFIFLPIALVGYYLVAKLGAKYAVAWLVLASLAFYAVWNPAFVILLVCSIAFNFAIGRALLAREREEDTKSRNRLLFFGVAANLLRAFFLQVLGANSFVGHIRFHWSPPDSISTSFCRWEFPSLPSRRSDTWWTAITVEEGTWTSSVTPRL